ncbi:protein PLASTID REDOX INSENSITIVE 2, chloroplastic isoform X3 [Elaeis guineensis]|uniref:protein PLASTID REDOX INSENSITIVE 2, chloroplastic isoform X3 n=1 Tax=Elaeis guineensis var. tenera TaxID=51953 RepID=UPI003C6CEEEF
MACFNAPASLSPLLPSLPHHLPSSSLLFTRRRLSSTPPLPSRFHRSFPLISPSLPPFSSLPHSIQLLCRAAEYAEYKFPDPIPEFAEAETSKFRIHMLQRLTKKNEYFGDHVEEIVGICTEVDSAVQMLA